MKESHTILNHLLDKYENSKHLTQPGVSRRRVMLRIKQKELPEYNYEDAAVRDAYNAAARELEQLGMVHLEWVPDRPLLCVVALNLVRLQQCYDAVERSHPKDRAAHVERLVSDVLGSISTPWISAWCKDVYNAAKEECKIPSYCKENTYILEDLLCSFQTYATLSEVTTERAFSSKCYHDTKYFERNIRERFLRIAREYDDELSAACEEHELSEREQLAFLGIYARPELYELAGNCIIQTQQGNILLGAAAGSGLALPSSLIDRITAIDLKNIQCITFIENKTNYNEYLVSEQKAGELVVYQGGFLSPQKKKLFSKIAASALKHTKIQFWADIDTGGFRMFYQLNALIPCLQPMRMSEYFVEKYHKDGFMRSKKYLDQLQADAQNGKYPLFQGSISAILKYGVTIEQEIFLN